MGEVFFFGGGEKLLRSDRTRQVFIFFISFWYCL